MSQCRFCELIEKKLGVVYEDEKTIAMLHPTPCAPGHIVIMPRKHYPIMEQVPDYVVGDLFTKANKISIALFEGLGAEGTNIFVQNGAAAGQKHNHFIVHIIPRKQNDGLPLTWRPKQLSEEEMSTIELKVKEEAKSVGVFEKEKEKPIEEEKPAELKPGKEEDYRLKHLERIP